MSGVVTSGDHALFPEAPSAPPKKTFLTTPAARYHVVP
jgi:hypothetical protein